jgi:PAS domain S-box-containing protein
METLPPTSDAAENERALMALLDSVDGVVFEYNLELDRYVVVRGKREALLGYSAQEWCEPGFWAAHVHPDDVETAHGFCIASIDARRDHQFEYRMLARDGRSVWIHDHVTLVQRDGRPFALRGVMLDVTERRAAEALLRRTHDRFASLLDGLSAGLLFEDEQRRILFANRALGEALGVPSTQQIGQDCRVLLRALLPQFVEPLEVEARIEELIARRAPAPSEDVRMLDGRVFERSYVPFEAHGQRGHLWQFQDVTERRRAERALRDISAATAAQTGEAFCRELVRELSRALGVRIAFVAEVDARDETRLRLLSIFDQLGAARLADRDIPGSPCELTLERGEFLSNGALAEEFPKHFAVAELGARSYFGVPLRSADGAVRGVLAVLHDAPFANIESARGILAVFAGRAGAELERQRAEDALRASEARYRALLETFPDMLFVVDSGGVFLDYHAPDPRLLLLPPEEFLGRRLADVLPEPLATPMGVLLSETFATGRPQRSVRALAVPVGERTFEYRIVPFGRDRALIIARDITEQRRLEDRLFQAQKLESIGRMAGGVAHDFNNLLTGILGYAELGAIEAADGALGEYFRRIQLAGERAAGLTKQLLAFAREELVEPRVVAPNDLVDEMLAFLRRVIGEHVQLETELAADAWRARIDPTQFYSVLMNLVVNARDALPSGGVVRIATRNARIEGETSGLPAGDYIELTVSDDGVGMDETTRQRAFEPFFTTKDAGRGVGMGLATCYGIVRQNGGAIQVSSREGEGTRVQVLLPRVDQPRDARPARPETQVRGSERVLLVEDDRVVREIAVGALVKLGYRVLPAADGEEALELALGRLDEIDVLVTDVVMPRLGGDALAARLRERRRDLPVLFISGYAPAGDGEARGSTLLRKPFAPADLARKLREVLDAHAAKV